MNTGDQPKSMATKVLGHQYTTPAGSYFVPLDQAPDANPLTRSGKAWGWFTADGKPVATGNAWHDWVCPKRRWVTGATEICDETGLPSQGPPILPHCDTKVVSAKREVCQVCGNQFIYP